MKLSELPQRAQEALHYWQALRALDYPANAIFIGPQSVVNAPHPEVPYIVVQLRWKGQTWNGIVGMWTDDMPDFDAVYVQMFEAIQASTQAERKAFWDASRFVQQSGAAASLAMSLVQRGLYPP